MKRLLVYITLLSSYSLNSLASGTLDGFINIYAGGLDYHQDEDYLYSKMTENPSLNGSSAGLSYTGQIGNRWLGKVQLLGNLNKSSDESNNIQIDIFNLTYNFNDNLQARIGRIRFNTWLYSEVLQIGALYPFTALPVIVYGKLPVSSFNGAEITYNNSYKKLFYSISLFSGDNVGKEVVGNGEFSFRSKNNFGGFVELDFAGLLLKYSSFKSYTYDGEYLDPNMTVPIDLGDTMIENIGMKYEYENFWALYERVKINSDSSTYKHVTSEYMSLGVHINNRIDYFMLTYARDVDLNATFSPNKIKSIGLTYGHRIDSVTLGKLQVEHLEQDNNVLSASPANSPFTAISASINTIF